MNPHLVLCLTTLVFGLAVISALEIPKEAPEEVILPLPVILCPENISAWDCNTDCIQHHNTKRGICTYDHWCECLNDIEAPIENEKGPALGRFSFNSFPYSDVNTLLMEEICISDCNCVHNQEYGYCVAPWSGVHNGVEGSPFCICTGGKSKGCRRDKYLELIKLYDDAVTCSKQATA